MFYTFQDAFNRVSQIQNPLRRRAFLVLAVFTIFPLAILFDLLSAPFVMAFVAIEAIKNIFYFLRNLAFSNFNLTRVLWAGTLSWSEAAKLDAHQATMLQDKNILRWLNNKSIRTDTLSRITDYHLAFLQFNKESYPSSKLAEKFETVFSPLCLLELKNEEMEILHYLREPFYFSFFETKLIGSNKDYLLNTFNSENFATLLKLYSSLFDYFPLKNIDPKTSVALKNFKHCFLKINRSCLAELLMPGISQDVMTLIKRIFPTPNSPPIYPHLFAKLDSWPTTLAALSHASDQQLARCDVLCHVQVNIIDILHNNNNNLNLIATYYTNWKTIAAILAATQQIQQNAAEEIQRDSNFFAPSA